MAANLDYSDSSDDQQLPPSTQLKSPQPITNNNDNTKNMTIYNYEYSDESDDDPPPITRQEMNKLQASGNKQIGNTASSIYDNITYSDESDDEEYRSNHKNKYPTNAGYNNDNMTQMSRNQYHNQSESGIYFILHYHLSLYYTIYSIYKHHK